MAPTGPLPLTARTEAEIAWLSRHLGLSRVRVIEDLVATAIHAQLEHSPTTEAVDILGDSSRGRYIGNALTDHTQFGDWVGIDSVDWDIVRNNPDSEWYWESLDRMCQNAVYVGPVEKWLGCRLHLNGDLFIVSPNYSYPEF